MDNVVPFVSPAMIKAREAAMRLTELAKQVNAAEDLDDETLVSLGAKVCREYEIDKDSRKDWEDRARRAMDLAKQKKTEKSTPWPNASNVKYPMLTTAALQFAARAYPAICDGPRIVKARVLGADPDGRKATSADNVSQHMSYQLLQEVDGWESDVDTALHQIPIIGCAFKKVYEDDAKPAGYCDELVSAFDFVVNQKTRSLKTVPRATHVFTLYPHEIKYRQRIGRFLDLDLKASSEDAEDEDAPVTLLEQHRYLDLDDDGVEEPWIVTVHEKTQTVLRITACFDLDGIETDKIKGSIVKVERKDYFVKLPFVPDPEGGFYDVGFGHLLEPISDVIDSTINQMMDAGTLQNSGGGFIGSGVNLGKGKSVVSFKPGEYRTIQSAGNDLRQAIVNIEHPGPSKVLFELLGMMIEAGKDVAAIQDILVGDSPRNQTATTTMAMIEQGLKVFTAIYKRLYRALQEEFKIIFKINSRSLQVPKYVALLDKPVQVVGADYMGDLDVMPIADPNTVTDMQRMAKAQFVMEEAKAGNPHINLFEATKRAFEAARIDQPEEVLVPPPPPDQQQPPSPEEQLAQAKMAELQAKTQAASEQAQIKIQSMMMDLDAKAQETHMKLQAKQEDMALQFEAKQRAFEQSAVEKELSHQEQLRKLQLQSDQLDQKWRELQLREEQIAMKAEEAKAKSPA